MSPEQIIEEEMHKWGEYLEEIDQIQTSAFLVGVLAHRIEKAETYNKYLKQRLEHFESGRIPRKIEDENV